MRKSGEEEGSWQTHDVGLPVRQSLPNVLLRHMLGLANRRRVRGLAVDEPLAFLVREPLAVGWEVGDEEECRDADDERCESFEDLQSGGVS